MEAGEQFRGEDDHRVRLGNSRAGGTVQLGTCRAFCRAGLPLFKVTAS